MGRKTQSTNQPIVTSWLRKVIRKHTEAIHFLVVSFVFFSLQLYDIATFYGEFKLYNVNFTHSFFFQKNKKTKQKSTTNNKIMVYLLSQSIFIYKLKISSHDHYMQ